MQRYINLAQTNRLWLSLGGFQEHCRTDPQRLQNCHVIVDDTGQIVSTYRKVHLFDVEVFNGPVLKETSFTVPGKQVLPISKFLPGHPVMHQVVVLIIECAATLVGIHLCVSLTSCNIINKTTGTLQGLATGTMGSACRSGLPWFGHHIAILCQCSLQIFCYSGQSLWLYHSYILPMF